MSIPKTWEKTELVNLLTHVIGGSWGKEPEYKSDEYDYAYCIRGTELKNWCQEKGRTAALRKIKKSALNNRILEDGDLILEISGGGPNQPVGRVEIIDKSVLSFEPNIPKICTNFFRLIRPNEEIHAPFLLFYLKCFYQTEDIFQFQSGSNNLRNLKFEEYVKILVPLPPLNEQKRIVDKIELLFSDLDKGEALLKQAQQQLGVYRQAVLKAAVTGELTKEWREQNEHRLESGEVLLQRILELRRKQWKGRGKYQEPIAPNTFGLLQIPDSWSYCNVEQLTYVETGATPKKGNKLYYENGSIPWITSTAVNQHPINDYQSLITENALRETNVKIFPIGTLILAMYGEGKTRGSVSELNIEAGTNQACAGLICEHLPCETKCFLKLFLKYNYNLIRLESAGGVQPNLNLGIVKQTVLPLPSTEEQNEIVDRINDIFSQIDALEQWCATELARSGMLRQSILKAAFSGELVPQDPRDEPASELLARIQAERASAARDKFKKAKVQL